MQNINTQRENTRKTLTHTDDVKDHTRTTYVDLRLVVLDDALLGDEVAVLALRGLDHADDLLVDLALQVRLLLL